MGAPAPKPLRASVYGLDEHATNALRLLFLGPYENRCILTREKSADVAIFDIDSVNGSRQLIEFRQSHPDKPTIVLSMTNPDIEDVLFVNKPILPSELISVLDKVKGLRLRKSTVSPIEAIPAINTAQDDEPASGEQKEIHNNTAAVRLSQDETPDTKTSYSRAATLLGSARSQNLPLYHQSVKSTQDSNQLFKAYYRPQDFLQGHLQEACRLAFKKGLPVRVEGVWRPITILPDTNQIVVEENDKHLRAICFLPQRRKEPEWRRDVTVTVLKEHPFNLDQEELSAQAIDALIWKLAVWTSKGRVPEGTMLDTPVHLRRWPNLTRLLPIPHSLRIAALWMEYLPCSLLETASVLRIPQEYVFTFYSALLSLELIETDVNSDNTTSSNNAVQQHHQRSLLKRIMNRLSKHSAT